MTKTLTRHTGPRASMRAYTDEQIKEMEQLRYHRRMSFAAIGKQFNTTGEVIEGQLCRNGNHYADDRPLRAKPFDGWNFAGMDVEL